LRHSRKRDATEATASTWVERLARAGFVAKALLYGTIGMLAASAALGVGSARNGGATDTRGAMATVLAAPLGKILLAAIGVALIGYAAWRVVEGIVDPDRRGNGVKGLALRASFVARGVAHAALAVTAFRFAAAGASADQGGDTSRAATKAALDMRGGEWIVWLAALSLAGYGAYQLYRAVAAKLSKQLDTHEMSGEAGQWLVGVSRFGIAARGVVFVALGWLFVRAATQHDPSEAGGIGEALQTLRDLGRWPFAAIAIGLIAYGGYQGLNARYRRMRTAKTEN
jgi:hypothetical protein